MRSHALPGSSHTDAVLTAGAELFCATLLELPVDLQVKQLEGLAQLRRVAKGLPGAYNVQPSEETCKLALKTLSDIERWLADRLSELPLPARAEALSVLHGDSNAAVADATLSEYIMVAHPRPLAAVVRHGRNHRNTGSLMPTSLSNGCGAPKVQQTISTNGQHGSRKASGQSGAELRRRS
jgi:hypothetical protein